MDGLSLSWREALSGLMSKIKRVKQWLYFFGMIQMSIIWIVCPKTEKSIEGLCSNLWPTIKKVLKTEMWMTTFYTDVLFEMQKVIAPHSSTLAWKIPWMEEPGRLQSIGSLRVRHDWATSLSLFTFMHRRRKWQPTPVFLPGESQGRRSMVGCRLWGHTESDMTETT